MDKISAFDKPTEADISAMERLLDFTFPPAYRDFLKAGGNVENALYEPALVLPGIERLYLANLAKEASELEGVPRTWLPFIEDNGDYFLLSSKGEVRFWSHNGVSDERWSRFSDWFQQCCVQLR